MSLNGVALPNAIPQELIVKTKKTPAPQRAGTGNGKMRDRAVRETRVVKQLEWMRANDPAAFTDMMKVLARLVVRARSKQK